MEGRQEEVLRRHHAAAMMDNLSIRLMEADPENYSCTLATLRKAQLLQQQKDYDGECGREHGATSYQKLS